MEYLLFEKKKKLLNQYYNKITSLKKVNTDNIQRETEAEPIITEADKKAVGLDSAKSNVDNLEFRIALISRYSAGKSMFLNSMLGEELLVSGTNETTSLITEIVKSDSKVYAIETVDTKAANNKKGNISILETDSLEEIRDKINEITVIRNNTLDNNLHDSFRYKKIILKGKFDILSKGVIFVDTPGLGTKYSNESSIITDVIPNAQSIIFLFDKTSIDDDNVQQQVSKFVKKAKNRDLSKNPGEDLFFIINKLDETSDKEKKEIEEKLKTNLALLGIDNPNILYYSAKKSLFGQLYREGKIEAYSPDNTIRTLETEGVKLSVEENGVIMYELRAIGFDKTKRIETANKLIEQSNYSNIKTALLDYFAKINEKLIYDYKTALVKLCKNKLNAFNEFKDLKERIEREFPEADDKKKDNDVHIKDIIKKKIDNLEKEIKDKQLRQELRNELVAEGSKYFSENLHTDSANSFFEQVNLAVNSQDFVQLFKTELGIFKNIEKVNMLLEDLLQVSNSIVKEGETNWEKVETIVSEFESISKKLKENFTSDNIKVKFAYVFKDNINKNIVLKAETSMKEILEKYKIKIANKFEETFNVKPLWELNDSLRKMADDIIKLVSALSYSFNINFKYNMNNSILEAFVATLSNIWTFLTNTLGFTDKEYKPVKISERYIKISDFETNVRHYLDMITPEKLLSSFKTDVKEEFRKPENITIINNLKNLILNIAPKQYEESFSEAIISRLKDYREFLNKIEDLEIYNGIQSILEEIQSI